jgi:hypothetical protein
VGVRVRMHVAQWRRRLGLVAGCGRGGGGRLLAGQCGDGFAGHPAGRPRGHGDGKAAHTVLRGDGGLEGSLLQLSQLLNRRITINHNHKWSHRTVLEYFKKAQFFFILQFTVVPVGAGTILF